MTCNYHISLDTDALLDAVGAALSSSTSSSSPSSSRRSSDSNDTGSRVTVLLDVPIRLLGERFEPDPPPPYSRLPSSGHLPTNTSCESLTTTTTEPSSPAPWKQSFDETCSDSDESCDCDKSSNSSKSSSSDESSDSDESSNSDYSGDSNDSNDFETRRMELRCEINEQIRQCETHLQSLRDQLYRLDDVDPSPPYLHPPAYQHPPAYTSAASLSIALIEQSSPSPSPSRRHILDAADPPLPCSPPPTHTSTESLATTPTEPSSPSSSSSSSSGQNPDEADSDDGGVYLGPRPDSSRSSRRFGVCYLSNPDSPSSWGSSTTAVELDGADRDAVGAEQQQQSLASLSSSLRVLHSDRGRESRSHSPEHVPVRRRQRLWQRVRRMFRFLRRS